MTMSNARWAILMESESLPLTQEEKDEGWHFCYGDWDGLLIAPHMLEWDSCGCGIKPKEKS